MFRSSVARLVKFLFAVAMFVALTYCRPAMASDVMNFAVSGTVACGSSADCSAVVGTSVSGTFSVDTSTNDVGGWSFTTPYGSISSSGANAFSENVITGPVHSLWRQVRKVGPSAAI